MGEKEGGEREKKGRLVEGRERRRVEGREEGRYILRVRESIQAVQSLANRSSKKRKQTDGTDNRSVQ